MPLPLPENRRITVKFFSKKKGRKTAENPLVQCVSGDSAAHPFSQLDSYMPLARAEQELYESLREAVPIIDAAIGKLVRLTGDFTVECKSRETTAELNRFLNGVNVNGTESGIYEFLNIYLDQLLTYGQAVGEVVCNNRGTEICGLYNGSLKDITVKHGDTPMSLVVCRNNAEQTPLEYQELIMFTMLNPAPGALHGTSLLKGLPFVSSVLLKIIGTIGNNFERLGNLRFAVTYKPQSNSSFECTKESVKQIADEWSKAMRTKGEVCDFVSAGDVSIKVIGADNQIIDSDLPIRHMLEQIIAKFSIPPFLLGLNWSSTERMSSQQTDILTSELKYYRQQLNPVISKICSLWMKTRGIGEEFEIKWYNINLQDEKELAQARLYNAQARAIEIENMQKESEAGWAK